MQRRQRGVFVISFEEFVGVDDVGCEQVRDIAIDVRP